MKKVLIVDDEQDMLDNLRDILEDNAFEVKVSTDGYAALDLLKSDYYPIIITDLKMPGMDGLELLKRVKRSSPESSVIIMTGYGSIESAVQAMKMGAYYFITKGFHPDELIYLINRALERSSLLNENDQLKREIERYYGFKGLIGKNQRFQEIVEFLQKIANTDASILIYGASGTGKELVARAIHYNSTRAAAPFVTVNCAAIPESLIESELFGYERGAFTNAVGSKQGKFEMADRGTLFLDEIGDMSIQTQAKVLRALQEGELERVGGKQAIRVDVRVISATNKDLNELIDKKQFRHDLYYRLNVIEVQLPALTERKDDIPLLISHFLHKYSHKYCRPTPIVDDETTEYMMKYAWPGNIRELENIIERMVILCDEGDVITSDYLPETVTCYSMSDEMVEEGGDIISYRVAKRKAVSKFTKAYIRDVLEFANGNVTESAQIAGIERQSFQRLMKQYGINSADFRRSQN